MKKRCPKCGNEGTFGYFGEPDAKGIIAMFRHLQGTTQGKDLFGRAKTYPNYKRCFITQEELEAQPWYEEWKRVKDENDKARAKEIEQEMEEAYIQSFIRDNDNKEE